MAMEQGGSGTEAAAQRNARLQAAFNAAQAAKTTTAPKAPTVSYPATSYVAPKAPAAPTAPKTAAPTYNVQAIQSTQAPAVPALSQTAQSQLTQTAQELGLNTFGQPSYPATSYMAPAPPAQQSTWQRAADYTFTEQGSTKTYEDQLIADSARLTGQAIFNYGQIPNVISTTVANQLPYTYYGYSSADQFLKDLGYYEQSPGQWIQGEAGVGTTAGGGLSGTSSYRYATSGGGYTGRYAGASTGLMNWRIGF